MNLIWSKRADDFTKSSFFLLKSGGPLRSQQIFPKIKTFFQQLAVWSTKSIKQILDFFKLGVTKIFFYEGAHSWSFFELNRIRKILPKSSIDFIKVWLNIWFCIWKRILKFSLTIISIFPKKKKNFNHLYFWYQILNHFKLKQIKYIFIIWYYFLWHIQCIEMLICEHAKNNKHFYKSCSLPNWFTISYKYFVKSSSVYKNLHTFSTTHIRNANQHPHSISHGTRGSSNTSPLGINSKLPIWCTHHTDMREICAAHRKIYIPVNLDLNFARFTSFASPLTSHSNSVVSTAQHSRLRGTLSSP